MIFHGKWLRLLGVLLLLNSAYLFGRDDANVFYVSNILFHLGAGIVLTIFALPWLWRSFKEGKWLMRLVALLLVGGVGTGAAIAILGGTRPFRSLVAVHVGLMTAGLILLPVAVRLRSGEWGTALKHSGVAIVVSLVLAGFLKAMPESFVTHEVNNSGSKFGTFTIRNPDNPPVDMSGENALGVKSPFYPSSVETKDWKYIPSKFFMESEKCGEAGCHPDITAQWRQSVHRLSSFNNQWYRSSIQYMQDIQGNVQGSKWCAGCHDPAVLLTGMWTKPIEEMLDQPEAHAGLGCSGCHSISHIKNTMGNGGMVYEYPYMHRLTETDNKLLKAIHDYVIKLDPAPHRQTFLKTFHTEQTSEFCSSCHKVHLDKDFNNFRWTRGFNEYDAWQISGVSGQGALAFYYPKEFRECGDCHMPLVDSKDKGNRDGKVHSHRFATANSALPYAYKYAEQFKAVEEVLKGKIITMDIFGMSIGKPSEVIQGASGMAEGPVTMSLSGDESQLIAGASGGSVTDTAKLIAPFGPVKPSIRRGDSARVSVVVRTRGIGHRFPGGTFDAFDVWVEMEARDNKGQLIFHSGGLEQDGQVDRGAHFYRAVMLDGNGNLINKRNAFAARTILYARGIPPGAADTVHFRLNVPENCGDEITLTARLHYRKFDHFNTHFSYAGVPADNGTYSLDHDDRTWKFTGDTSNVAGALKEIPQLPIITIAEATAKMKVLPKTAQEPKPETLESVDLRERWNDYGIGLLLQGDLKGAREVFEKVTRMEPEYSDGWVNVARAALREGDLEGAETHLKKAIEVLEKTPPTNPARAKAYYFLAEVHQSRGEYDEALKNLQVAVARFPRDRNILNKMGRIHFLRRDFKKATDSLKRTIEIDPEDLMAHYNLMLAYRGLGDNEKAEFHQTLYMRFKADESSQAITGDVRRKYPELNLERQAIREHFHMPMPSVSPLEYDRKSREAVGFKSAETESGKEAKNPENERTRKQMARR